MPIPLLYLHLGDKWPEHAQFTHAQARKCGADLLTICKPSVACREFNLKEFQSFGFYDGPDSFWGRTALRLFEVGRIMEAHGLRRMIHMENDVFPWRDVNPVFEQMATIYGDGIACTPLDRSRCTAATLYIGSWAAYSEFMHQLRLMLQTPHKQLLTRVDPDIAINEMHLLRLMEWDHPDLITMLPVVPADKHATVLGVFDPAGYGQALDGGPGCPGTPWHLKGTIVGGHLASNACSIEWREEGNGYAPFVAQGTVCVPLQTTHVHTKRIQHVLTRYGSKPQ